MFWGQSFYVAFEPVLEVALVEGAGLKLTEICLPLPPKCWNKRHVPPPPGISINCYTLSKLEYFGYIYYV